ncbi:MAG TPA: NADH-quinone oxidoreductase subunit M [Aeromicrobium sp.]|nr:NADH-quinone oxidoreductase subunit M [Aeromicrobium sp.]
MIAAAMLAFAVAALVLTIAPRAFAGRRAAELGAVASLVALVELARIPIGKPGTLWAEIDRPWIGALGAHFHVGVDEISWPFALLTAALTLACCIWLWQRETSPALVALLMVIAGASLGVFVAQDLLLFFIFFEFALVPMWFVIARWGENGSGGGEARRAATKFLLYTVIGSSVMFVGFVLVALRGHSLQIDELRGSSSLTAAILIAVGLAVKVPLVPVHTWLPDAHSKAPTVGSVLLAGIFLKLGTYGLIRLNVQMLPQPTERIAPWLAGLGVLGIVWAGFACLAQDDLKRLVAYSSVGHMGFVALAIATMSQTGIIAAVFGSVAHGLITGLLFFLAGSLKERYGTASLAALGRGLYGRAPWRAVAILAAGLATIGLPGLAGFWGEFLTLRAAFEPASLLPQTFSIVLMVIATAGIVLATAYVARFARSLLQGVPTRLDLDRDLWRREAIVVGGLLLPILVLGFFPVLITGLSPAIGYAP